MTLRAITSPFKGLAPFDDSDLDALLFFGRARETETIAANLQASRLTVLHGPSGVGKSSILRAGVAHRLRLEPDVDVRILDLWAAGDPGAALRAAADAHDGRDLYLILDQFEEYFVYHGDDEEFAVHLADVLSRPRVNVLIGIREDSLARLDVFKRRLPGLFGNRLRLERLDRRAAEEAIRGPIAAYNRGVPVEDAVEIEPELVPAVLDEVAVGRVQLGGSGRGAVGNGAAADRIEAPFLQLVLESLWEAEREAGSNHLRLETLRRLGGASQIVRDHLERAMGDLTPDEREAAAAMYHHLVTPSGTKIAHGVGDLAGYAGVDETQASAVLSKLAGERILRGSSENGPATIRYEIFHDVLADAVLEWRARHDEERRLRRAQEQHRRARLVATGALIGLVVVAAIAVFALLERSHARAQARRAHARELVADAATILGTDPGSAVRFALRAARIEPGPREEDVLRTALLRDRERVVLHAGAPVTVVAFNRAGSRVLTGSLDGKLRIYDRASGRLVDVLEHGSPIAVAAFAPGGRLVLTGGSDGRVRVWTTATGKPLRSLDAGGPVRSAAFGPRGTIVSAAANGILRLWRRSSGTLMRTIRAHTRTPLISAARDPTGRLVTTVSRDRFARVYSFPNGRLVHVFPQKGYVGNVVFSPDGKFLLTCGNEGTVRLWRASTGTLVREFTGPRSAVTQALLSPDGKLVAGASDDGTARVWNLATGLQQAILIGHGAAVVSVAFSPDSAGIVTTSADGTGRVWTTDGGRFVAVLTGHSGPVVSALYSPDGRSVVTAGDDGTARIWDPNTDPVVPPIRNPLGVVTGLAFSPDGHRFATAGARVAVWNTVPRRVEWSATAPSPALSVTYARDGREIATLHADGTVRVWSAPDGALLRTHSGPAHIVAAAFAPDGRLVTASNLAVFVGDRKLPQSAPVEDIAVSPDGKLVAVAGDDAVGRIERLDDGAVVRTLKAPVPPSQKQPLRSIAFSADGKRLVIGSSDKTARIWNVGTGRLLATETSSFGPVVDAAFSPDGRWLVTAAPVTAPVSRVSDARRLVYLRGPTDLLTSVAFGGPDGHLVLMASRDGTVRAYDCKLCGDVHALVHLAERRLATAR